MSALAMVAWCRRNGLGVAPQAPPPLPTTSGLPDRPGELPEAFGPLCSFESGIEAHFAPRMRVGPVWLRELKPAHGSSWTVANASGGLSWCPLVLTVVDAAAVPPGAASATPVTGTQRATTITAHLTTTAALAALGKPSVDWRGALARWSATWALPTPVAVAVCLMAEDVCDANGFVLRRMVWLHSVGPCTTTM